MNQNETVNILSKLFQPWDKLNETEKQQMADSVTEVDFKKGTNVHNGSVDCIGVLLIKKGRLRVYILSDEGKEITLYRLGTGDMCILSASCVLATITFDVHIDAEEDSEVVIISPCFYSQLCEENIYVKCKGYELLTNRFSDVMWAMQQILFMSYDKRLAIFLWDESIQTGDDTIHLTHEQVAKYTGSAREVVTRMLKYFSEEGIVELSRGGIKIINRQKLKALTK